MLNLAAVLGIWVITSSGMCPFNAFNLNEPTETDVLTGDEATGVGVLTGNNFAQVPSPTIPSSTKPLAFWNC